MDIAHKFNSLKAETMQICFGVSSSFATLKVDKHTVCMFTEKPK